MHACRHLAGECWALKVTRRTNVAVCALDGITVLMMAVRVCAGILQKAMGWREYWEQQPQAGFVYAHYGTEGGMAAAELKVACMQASCMKQWPKRVLEATASGWPSLCPSDDMHMESWQLQRAPSI